MSLLNFIPKHKVFISFHSADERYKLDFERLYSEHTDGFITRSVQDGDININIATETIRQQIRDHFIADSTVTIVLIGESTWRRKHVDWEISSSIKATQRNSRNGLLGVFLPSYPFTREAFTNTLQYNPHTIPPRLHENVTCGFADLYLWSELTPYNIRKWVDDAFRKRATVVPDNSYPSFVNNKPSTQTQWSW